MSPGVGHHAIASARTREQLSSDVNCALRVVSGEQAGLSTRWRHGIGLLTLRHKSFRRHIWQTAIPRPSSPSIEIDVVSIDPLARRGHGLRDFWSVSLEGGAWADILTIETSTAVIDWALITPGLSVWAYETLVTPREPST